MSKQPNSTACRKAQRVPNTYGMVRHCTCPNGHKGPHKFGPLVHRDTLGEYRGQKLPAWWGR